MRLGFNNTILPAIFIFIGMLNAHSQTLTNQTIGELVSWKELEGGQVKIQLSNAVAELTPYRSDVIRVHIYRLEKYEHPNYSIVNQAQGSFSIIEEQEDVLNLLTGSLKIEVQKEPFAIVFYDHQGTLLSADDKSFAVNWQGDQVTSYKSLMTNEKFIGLGEKTGDLNRRGSGYVHWNTDAYGYDNATDPIYSSIPFYMGIHDEGMYGIFFNNSFKTSFNFGASNYRFSSFSAEYGDLDYFFFGAQDISGILDDYTWLTGRMPMPPKWSLGYQQCRYSYFPDTEVMRIAETFRSKSLPADMIYLDIHYMEQYKVFTFDSVRFPSPQNMVEELNQMGFKTAVILDPGIKVEPGYAPYDKGIQKGLFVNYPDGTLHEGQVWPGRCHFPDFTNPSTRDWWAKEMQFYTNLGIKGFWNDMNEPASWGQTFPELVEFDLEGRKGTYKEAHNLYGMQMSKATYDGVLNATKHARSFHLTRATFAGGQRFAAKWTGDNQSNDEHMLLGVRLINSLGLSGYAFSGADVGGFIGSPSKELYARWMSLGAFTPLYRGHTEFGSEQQEPWTYGQEIEEICRKYLNLRYELFPYVYTAFWQAHKTGLPVSRAMVLYEPREDLLYDKAYQHQYYFGDHLLVAPLESTENHLSVYFPEGQWHRIDRKEIHEGSVTELVTAPLNALPVFVRGGAVIPRMKLVQHLSQDFGDTLFLHIYPGKGVVQSSYYEDDGETNAYEQARHYYREFTYSSPDQTLVLTHVEGDYNSRFKVAKYVWHGKLATVKSSGKRIKLTTTPEGNVTFALPWEEQGVTIHWQD